MGSQEASGEDQISFKIWERKHDDTQYNMVRSETHLKDINIVVFLEYFKEIPASWRSMVAEQRVIEETETEKIWYLKLNIPNDSPRDCLTRTKFTREDNGCFIEVKSIFRDDVPEVEGVTRMLVHNRGLVAPSPEAPQDILIYKSLSMSSLGGSSSPEKDNEAAT